MAAGRMPGPGSEYGPCATECAHRDCAATRALVAAPCVSCGDEIGYENGFYQNFESHRVNPGDEPEYEHSLCSYKRRDV